MDRLEKLQDELRKLIARGDMLTAIDDWSDE